MRRPRWHMCCFFSPLKAFIFGLCKLITRCFLIYKEFGICLLPFQIYSLVVCNKATTLIHLKNPPVSFLNYNVRNRATWTSSPVLGLRHTKGFLMLSVFAKEKGKEVPQVIKEQILCLGFKRKSLAEACLKGLQGIRCLFLT